jgi:hypothetical protein
MPGEDRFNELHAPWAPKPSTGAGAEEMALGELSIDSMAVPTLQVWVDFGALVDSVGEAQAFELVGKLKDLLA